MIRITSTPCRTFDELYANYLNTTPTNLDTLAFWWGCVNDHATAHKCAVITVNVEALPKFEKVEAK